METGNTYDAFAALSQVSEFCMPCSVAPVPVCNTGVCRRYWEAKCVSAGTPLLSSPWDFSAASPVAQQVPVVELSSQSCISVREFLVKTKSKERKTTNQNLG